MRHLVIARVSVPLTLTEMQCSTDLTVQYWGGNNAAKHPIKR